jgi:hypothetical protein
MCLEKFSQCTKRALYVYLTVYVFLVELAEHGCVVSFFEQPEEKFVKLTILKVLLSKL